ADVDQQTRAIISVLFPYGRRDPEVPAFRDAVAEEVDVGQPRAVNPLGVADGALGAHRAQVNPQAMSIVRLRQEIRPYPSCSDAARHVPALAARIAHTATSGEISEGVFAS